MHTHTLIQLKEVQLRVGVGGKTTLYNEKEKERVKSTIRMIPFNCHYLYSPKHMRIMSGVFFLLGNCFRVSFWSMAPYSSIHPIINRWYRKNHYSPLDWKMIFTQPLNMCGTVQCIPVECFHKFNKMMYRNHSWIDLDGKNHLRCKFLLSYDEDTHSAHLQMTPKILQFFLLKCSFQTMWIQWRSIQNECKSCGMIFKILSIKYNLVHDLWKAFKKESIYEQQRQN